MKWLKNLFGAGIGESASKVIDALARRQEGKIDDNELELAVQQILAADREHLHSETVAELGAKERILVAELQQGDAYTKRARPTVVYAGLVAIFLNHVIAPWSAYIWGVGVPEIELPKEFWWAWGGVVGTWTLSRTAEKLGKGNGLTRAVTGSEKAPSLLS